MSENYDNYGYETDEENSGSTFIRKLIIIIMIVIAIILLIFLIKGIKNKRNNSTSDNKFQYERVLLEASKKYFENNYEKMPKSVGGCEEIELEGLIERDLVDVKDFSKCNTTGTFVRVCKVAENKYQYSPWFVCIDKKSENEYAVETEGNLNDLVEDSTLVSFKFIPQVLKKNNSELGEEEEYWEDEVPYNLFKTISQTKYYRYRDQLFRWIVETRTYYTSTSEETNVKKVNEYYATNPNSNYNLKDSKTEGYKWYTTTSEKIYAVDNSGTKVFSHSQINGYPNYDNGVCVSYQTRTVTGTSNANHYYKCGKSKNSLYAIYQLNTPCGSSANPTYTYELDNFYTCGYGDYTEIENNRVASSSVKCSTYSEWKNSLTACDTTKDTCRQIEPYCVYNWYKVTSVGTKKYYPSGTVSADAEKVYYVSQPVEGAIKDESTKATVYKWYKSSTSTTSTYTAVAPSGYSSATKTGEGIWSNWSEYSAKNPKVNDGRIRQIETKTKLKVKQILDNNGSYDLLSNNYLTINEVIALYKSKGYDVETLDDITNNGELQLTYQMLIRNKKEK